MWKFRKFKLMEGAGDDGSQGGSGGGNTGGAGGSSGGEGGGGSAGGSGGSGGNKPSDAEAKLLKESMARKARIEELEKKLKDFEGVDPNEFKTLKQKEADAEAARKDAEKKELEKKGEWDRLKAQMAEEHTKVVNALQEQIDALKAEAAGKASQVVELTVGSAFANSKFISDELTLTPRKARSIYGDHFEVKDGAVVAYDKPAGAANRTVLVDGRGDPLAFEDAIKKLVDADPDRDSVLKAKVRAGSGASGGGAGSGAGGSGKPGAQSKTDADPMSRIRGGLAKQFKTLV